MIKHLLRAEWVALALGGAALYLWMGGDWPWLFPLLLAPDISMVGYLAGPRIGSISYNAVHNLVLAVAALAIGLWADVTWLALAGSVLVAHVGMDRSLGYGLKLATDFKDTHLGRIGR